MPDTIERLATCARQLLDAGAEIGRLRAALAAFAAMPGCWECEDDVVIYKNAGAALTAGDFRRAKAVLNEQQSDKASGS